MTTELYLTYLKKMKRSLFEIDFVKLERKQRQLVNAFTGFIC